MKENKDKTRKNFPDIKEFITTMNITRASIEDIEWIARLEAELFTGTDAIPEEVLKEWYSTNPTGFFIIKQNEERVGHIDILPLRPQTFDLLLKGSLIERQIRGVSLYTPNERNLIKNLYIECVSISLTGRAREVALLSLLSNISSMINKICPVENVDKIYAIAATKQGEQIMKHLGFTLAKQGEKRKDGHPMFVAEIKTLLKSIDQICGKLLN